MIGLHIVDALKFTKVLPRSIDLDVVRNLSISPETISTRELYFSLGSSRIDHEIKAALEVAFLKSNIDLNEKDIGGKLEVTYPWHQQLHRIKKEVEAFVLPDEKFILADGNSSGIGDKISGRKIIPFTERDGQYWGHPEDNETAIGEIERQRENWAHYIVFAWTAFWMLDYYTGMNDYLQEKFNCVLKDDDLVIFDLKEQVY